MDRALTIAKIVAWLSVAALCVATMAVVLSFSGTAARVNGVLERTDSLVKRGNQTLDAVNAPCTGFHGSVSCGTLAQLSQVEKNVGIVAGLAALQVKQSGALIAATTSNLNRVASHVDGAVDKMGAAAEQAKDSVAAVGESAQQVGAEAKPVLANAAEVEAHVDAFVTAPELRATVTHVAETSANVAAGSAEATQILRDGRREADALVAPKPWYRRVWSDTLKVGELVWDFAR